MNILIRKSTNPVFYKLTASIIFNAKYFLNLLLARRFSELLIQLKAIREAYRAP
jgi:hypothetical protein